MRYFKQSRQAVLLSLLLGILVTKKGRSQTHDTNALAYAYPTNAITLDGKLNDWPPDIMKYPIAKTPYDDSLSGPEDFNGYFQVGYQKDLNTLFFAIVIDDDSNVVDDTSEASWTSHDTYTLYLDAKHDKQGSGVEKYTFSPRLRATGKSHLSWDPGLFELMDWSKVAYKIKKTGNHTIVEFSVKPNVPIDEFSVLGLDIVAIDKDRGEKGNALMAWNDSYFKDRDFGRLGQLVLLPAEYNQLQPLVAQFQWAGMGVEQSSRKVRLESVSNPSFWILTNIDESGRLETVLPKGDYRLELLDPIVRAKELFYGLRVSESASILSSGAQANLEIQLEPIVHRIPKKGMLLDGADTGFAKKIDSFVKSYMDSYHIPGVSLAIIDQGRVANYRTYGVQNNYTKEPVNNRTRFEGASITKPFFAFAVLRLSERGLIDLDKPLYLYLDLPEDIEDDPRAKKLTARIVLSHSTGLPNWPWLTENGKLAIQEEPGTKYTYSGAGYGYLQKVIESLTGKEVVTVLQEEVVDVLGIENTYFEYQPFLLRNTAVGHKMGRWPHANDIRPTAHVASSMIADAESLAKFFIQILKRQGLKSETYDEFFKLHTITNPETASREGKHYFGLGLYFEETPLGLSFGHSGNNGDFKCDAVIFEDLGKGFVLMTNNGYGDALIYDLYDYLFYGEKKQ